jgi:hypothetical protein
MPPQVSPGGGPAAPGWIRGGYLAVAILMCLGWVAGGALMTAGIVDDMDRRPGEPAGDLGPAGLIVIVLASLLIYALVPFAIGWVMKTWTWLPAHERWTRHWKNWISPGMAGFFLLIPYFHFYWMFMITCGICDAVDRLRVQHAAGPPAPKGLAIAAGISYFVFPIVMPFLWYAFMAKIDAAAREIDAARVAATGPYTPYGYG